jgi:hypothetical protein
MAGAVTAEAAGPLVRFLRWCGMALVVASPLIVIATLLHPSRETAGTIIASEAGLIAAHALYTLAWLLVLLGLPGLYASQRGSVGRLGLAGFLVAFSGTYLIAVGGGRTGARYERFHLGGLASRVCCSSWPRALG